MGQLTQQDMTSRNDGEKCVCVCVCVLMYSMYECECVCVCTCCMNKRCMDDKRASERVWDTEGY